MEEKIGLIKGIECRLVKTDAELIEMLAKRTEISAEKVKEMMRYNIFTINQFATLTKLSVSHILNKTRPSVINGGIGTELNYCYPFQDTENEGPKFIYRDEKAEKFLKA
jgi:hypothetical protein